MQPATPLPIESSIEQAAGPEKPRWMKWSSAGDFLFGVVLLAWLYGVPFLLIVGLIRRTSGVRVDTIAQAKQFGAGTDRYLIWGLVLNIALPAAGLLLAAVTRQSAWVRYYRWVVLAAVGVYLLMSFVASGATAPLIGDHPDSWETPPPGPTHCVAISGGRGCPGG